MSEYEVNEHPLGADTHLIISPPIIADVDYAFSKWKIEVFVNPSKKVILEYDGKDYKSSGDISANGKVDNGMINLYIKSSTVEWGKGELKAQMTIHLTNNNFEEKTQVIKTYLSNLGILIV